MNIHSIYRIFFKYFRRKRMEEFWRLFEFKKEMMVLDIGGNFYNWSFHSKCPKLVILNLSMPDRIDCKEKWIVGDGRYLPFKDEVFDVVYNNSVIEHLGSIENQRLFAAESRHVGQNYYVQTPNRWFFIEPHLITPFVHWLPRRVQKLFLRNFTVWGWITRPTRQHCESFMKELCLLDEREMKKLFPECKIYRECFLGIVKSIIAVKIPSH